MPKQSFGRSPGSPGRASGGFPTARRERVLGPRIEAGLRREVEDIAAVVPLEELAIQWDVAVEIGRREIFDQLVRLAAFVPERAELGYHLCSGDAPPEPGGARSALQTARRHRAAGRGRQRGIG